MLVWEHGVNRVYKKFKYFLLKFNFFIRFGLFWCANLKNNFKKIKYIYIFNIFQYEKYL